jgi:HAD superfamily hydrolase (TIGR01509 family)
MPAILFGSISTVADTSEIQRLAFNEAFQNHGLDWNWSRDDYRELLTGNGGQDRIAEYAKSRNQDVDAAAVHESKSKIFQERLGSSKSLMTRPGVKTTIEAAKAQGWLVGLVTTTSEDNVTALLDALSTELSRDQFDVVIDKSDVSDVKPDPAVYEHALSTLGLTADQAVAIEDNVGGVKSAQAAGLVCVSFPNENTVMHDFGDATPSNRLAFEELAQLVSQR